MRLASFGLLALILHGWGPSSFPGKGGDRTGRVQLDGFAAGTYANGRSHHLLMQCSVPWFVLGHRGLIGRCWAGRRGGCTIGRSCRRGFWDILLLVWQCRQHCPHRRQWLVTIKDILVDPAEPHFCKMKVVPASLSPHRKQRSGVPKMIQHGTQPQTKKKK